MLTIEDRRGEIIDTLWDVLDFVNCGPICRDDLEARVRGLIDVLVEEVA